MAKQRQRQPAEVTEEVDLGETGPAPDEVQEIFSRLPPGLLIVRDEGENGAWGVRLAMTGDAHPAEIRGLLDLAQQLTDRQLRPSG